MRLPSKTHKLKDEKEVQRYQELLGFGEDADFMDKKVGDEIELFPAIPDPDPERRELLQMYIKLYGDLKRLCQKSGFPTEEINLAYRKTLDNWPMRKPKTS